MGQGHRVVHYLNQFFAGLGGEEKAGVGISIEEGPVGPGTLLADLLKGQGELVATIVCGDNYFHENLEAASKEIVNRIREYKPGLFLAGPAFNAGRYGVACGHLCQAVQEALGIPAVTAMHPENPGVDLYRSRLYIVPTAERAVDMEGVLRRMVGLGLRLAAGESLGPASLEGYLPRGVRKNKFEEKSGAQRAVAMLLTKLKGDRYETEILLPTFEVVEPAPPLKDLASAKIAVVTTGGIIPWGNPDKLPEGRSTRWAKYPIAQKEALEAGKYETNHAGYDARFANQDPNRVVPLDGLRELEREGAFKKLHDYYYVTSGQGTYVAEAKKMGASLAEELLENQVTGAILTST